MHVLVVDDDPKLRTNLSRLLAQNDCTCALAGSVEEADLALEQSKDVGLDLILLDVMLPDSSGWEWLESVRSQGNTTPVIFITARHDVSERVRGLELGADDYVLKPFEFDELMARIRAVIRRKRAIPELCIGDLKMDLAHRIVERAGRRIETSAREFELLQVLAEHRGATVSRAELLKLIWGIEFDPGTNVVEVLVARVRRKLVGSGPDLIRTVQGEGYSLMSSS